MEWIKVSDRLPEDNEFVLVICSGFSPSWFEISEYYNYIFESQANGDNMNKYVTHWMPLPELPTE